MMIFLKRILIIGTSVAILSACDSAPAEQDLRTALVKQNLAVHGQQFIDNNQKSIAALKLLGCKKAEVQGYLCDVINVNGIGFTLKVVKIDGNWVILN